MNKLHLIAALLTLSSLVAGSQTVPDTNFTYIPANPLFAFTSTSYNTSTGETSPINEAYRLSKYMITNAQYLAFCIATNRAKPGYWTGGFYPEGKALHPVLYVSYTDAQAYCTWLTTQYTGWTFRLPTSAEWENAAKGPNKYLYVISNSDGVVYFNGILNTSFCYNGVTAAYYLNNFGNSITLYNNTVSPYYGTFRRINQIISLSSSGGVSGWVDHSVDTGFIYCDTFTAINARGGYTVPVNQFPGGAGYYGNYGMIGNAWTWTSSLDTAHNGEEAGQVVNVIRGGSWYATKPSCRTSYRGEGRIYTGKYNSVGFRIVAVPNISLPISIISFLGSTAKCNITLQWKTAQEGNNKGFFIERSTNGQNFEEMGFVPHKGNGSEQTSYNYTDATANDGKNYYRLHQVDMDGKIEFTSTILINNPCKSSILIYPNPAHNQINVQGNWIQLKIFDNAGKMVLLQKAHVSNLQPVYINHLAKGIYTVECLLDTRKIIIQKLIKN